MRILTVFLITCLFLAAQSQTQPRPTALVASYTEAGLTVYSVEVRGQVRALAQLPADAPLPVMEKDWLRLNPQQGIRLDDPLLAVVDYPTLAPIDDRAVIEAALRQPIAPLYGPVGVDLHYYEYERWGYRMYLMSGEGDPYVNLYALEGGETGGRLYQLTDVVGLFPELEAPILSASVDFIAHRPQIPGFLYRARLRDAGGTDHNALYFYDLAQRRSLPMPFFGKDPVWSPDGSQLVGSRLETLPDGRPLYRLWRVNLESGEETALVPGCNPHWSPDGAWIAYDEHDNAQSLNYTDCFANGWVAALNLETGDVIRLDVGIAGSLRLLGWLPE